MIKLCLSNLSDISVNTGVDLKLLTSGHMHANDADILNTYENDYALN
jgi:hypothetical protein